MTIHPHRAPRTRAAHAVAIATIALAPFSTMPAQPAPSHTAEADPYIWLEDVTGEKPLTWAREQNAASTRELEAAPRFKETRAALLAIYNSSEKIPYVTKQGELYYNFWQDEKHVRGIWRRTTFDEYRKPEPAWETVIDLDALAAAEDENWVWHGADILYPGRDRALVSLSRGGADADVLREFDLKTKTFVAPEAGGFTLPEAKNRVSWRDRDTLYAGTDTGPGSMTDSGYPRTIREWKRGAPLPSAPVVFEAGQTDMSVSASRIHDHGAHYDMLWRQIGFFTNETFLRNDSGAWVKINKPDDITVGVHCGQILLSLRKDWTVGGRTYPSGALLAADLKKYLAGARDFTVLFEPGPRKSLAGSTGTKNYLVVNELENVRNKLFAWSLDTATGVWTRQPVPAPDFGVTGVSAIDEDESDDVFIQTQDFLTPPSLMIGTIGKPADTRETLKRLPAFFDSAGMKVAQYEATSADGVKIPYFVVTPKNFRPDGSAPALLYGYGGFQISMLPDYKAHFGKAWIERGGVYVLANLRGGGEFGPAWHQAALLEKRQRAYDDFAAVAEDIIARKITSPARLGIMGGSNGGLLVGVAFTQRPDLYRAVVCQVPLLDMKRYNKLLAGASWMAEYGNPDLPEDWAFIRKYSPYQNVKPATAVKYPRIFFTTSTRDDRVHPGHARKMVALMKAQGHDVLYWENIEGGHGGAANAGQRARMWALSFTFLANELGLR
jgi:prolyl oligopeptidase